MPSCSRFTRLLFSCALFQERQRMICFLLSQESMRWSVSQLPKMTPRAEEAKSPPLALSTQSMNQVLFLPHFYIVGTDTRIIHGAVNFRLPSEEGDFKHGVALLLKNMNTRKKGTNLLFRILDFSTNESPSSPTKNEEENSRVKLCSFMYLFYIGPTVSLRRSSDAKK